MENVQIRKVSHPLIIIAAIALILFCAAGVAAIMGWIPRGGADSDVPLAKSQPKAVTGKTHTETQTRTQPSQPKQVAAVPAKNVCRECGVIESVRTVEQAGDAKGLGAVAGGVVGGVVGNQVGSGRGQDLATVAGAVGGAVAGHQIEKYVKKTTVYQINVRFDDGTTRVLTRSQAPTWRSGDRVKVVDGNIVAI